MPAAVLDVLPQLRGRSANVLVLALAQASPEGGGWWDYGSSREVAASIGFSASHVREAFGLLQAIGVFVEHEPPRNASGSGRARLAPHLWAYEEPEL